MMQKRKRGRPQGSGKNDEPVLMQVARKLVRDTSLKPTTAMRRVLWENSTKAGDDDTIVRRLQVKWRASGEDYLARARREIGPAQELAATSHAAKVAIDQFRAGLASQAAQINQAVRSFHEGHVQQTSAISRVMKELEERHRQQRALFETSAMGRVMKELEERERQQRALFETSVIGRAMEGMQKRHQQLAIARIADLPNHRIGPEMLGLSKPDYPTK